MQISEAIAAEQARYIHNNLLPAALTGGITVLVVSVMFWRPERAGYLSACVAAILAMGMFNVVLWRRFRRDTSAFPHAGRFLTLASTGMALTCTFWSIVLYLFFPADHYPQQIIYFCAAVVAGTTSVFSLGSYYPAFVVSFLPIALTCVLIIATQRSLFQVLLILMLIFIATLLLFAWRFNRLIITSLRLRFENTDLVKQLTEQKEVAESATLAKSRFLAAASHDLRQPMHALNLYLGAFAGYELPAQAGALLANVRQCAQTMDEMFRALLDISRLDASVVQADLGVFPMAALLDRIRVEFAPQAKAKGLTLRVPPCSAFVHSDPALIERILRNLVSNAVRYTEHGKILVGCRRTVDGLRLAVHDTGPGIAPEHQRAVFEEFYQVGNPGRDRAQGLGLGLAIVQRLALLLDARLSLSSEVGRGSMFALDLPGARNEEAFPAHTAPATCSSGRLAGALIVVVDDEAAILDATRALLEPWGCMVIAATSGSEAIERLSIGSRVPDAIVCDYRLRGDETGIDVIDALRNEFNQDIPTLLITGDTAPKRIREIQASGLPVLHKPLQEHVLREALSRLISAAETT